MSGTMADDNNIRRDSVYSRRKGHKLRPFRQALMRDLLPEIEIDLEAGPEIIDPFAVFNADIKQIWLEIGFGAGEHLALQAARRPDVGFIGCEPYVNGVAALLSRIAVDNLSNVRIFPGDARLLLARLAAGRIARLAVLFPDPWPKKRHHKRRIVCPEIIARCADILADGSEFRFATDHSELARWTLLHLHQETRFHWLAEGPRDWRERPEDWPETRYEQKAREGGRAPIFLRYRRVARGSPGAGLVKKA
jgi:tRNA (guanine-N7-)-methyltransferase